jgi:hypothetical protein
LGLNTEATVKTNRIIGMEGAVSHDMVTIILYSKKPTTLPNETVK